MRLNGKTAAWTISPSFEITARYYVSFIDIALAFIWIKSIHSPWTIAYYLARRRGGRNARPDPLDYIGEEGVRRHAQQRIQTDYQGPTFTAWRERAQVNAEIF